MCALCGLLSVLPHWSAAATVTDRPAVSHERLVRVANRRLANHCVKLSVFGGRIRVAGPTGRSEIVENLGALWPALDRMNIAFDLLDPGLVAAMEDKR